DLHSPWQRGLNENTNDLLRFFYPKGTDFLSVSEEEFQKVIHLINSRPRKCLGYLSPLEFLSKKCCT
ncbi:MAG: IS30 family transposase, partial [Clostridiales bacterium]|nr:IS30 family transposase [Clostridiales bacterium]